MTCRDRLQEELFNACSACSHLRGTDRRDGSGRRSVSGGLPVSERRRSGQRDRDGHRRGWPLRPGLRREDFTVYEDGKLQDISHFSNDRVPVSLGILLDTSGSMSPEKMSAARSAIDRLIYDLLDKDDELFLVEFSTRARLRQDWTTDRSLISRAVRETNATGGTAIYDAVADGDSHRTGRHAREESAAAHLRRQ